MKSSGYIALFSVPRISRQILIPIVSLVFLFVLNLSAQQDTQAPAPPRPEPQTPDHQTPGQNAPAPPYAQQSPDQLQQLVAPIALYPDSLVAQILAASTFPEQENQRN